MHTFYTFYKTTLWTLELWHYSYMNMWTIEIAAAKFSAFLRARGENEGNNHFPRQLARRRCLPTTSGERKVDDGWPIPFSGVAWWICAHGSRAEQTASDRRRGSHFPILHLLVARATERIERFFGEPSSRKETDNSFNATNRPIRYFSSFATREKSISSRAIYTRV